MQLFVESCYCCNIILCLFLKRSAVKCMKSGRMGWAWLVVHAIVVGHTYKRLFEKLRQLLQDHRYHHHDQKAL
jgi:hypothetical protein